MYAAQQIVDAVAAQLETVPAYAGKVYTDRAWPITEAELPALRVYADDESIDVKGISWPALQQHTLRVVVEGNVRAADNVDDAYHALTANVLTALYVSLSSTTLGGKAKVNHLERIERAAAGDGQAKVATVEHTLRIEFITAQNAPETIL